MGVIFYGSKLVSSGKGNNNYYASSYCRCGKHTFFQETLAHVTALCLMLPLGSKSL